MLSSPWQNRRRVLLNRRNDDHKRCGFRPRLERLEERATPATINLTSVADNTFYQVASATSQQLSNAIGQHFYVGETAQGINAIRRGAIRFDFSASPAGSTITGVTLTLNLSRVPAVSANTISLHGGVDQLGRGHVSMPAAAASGRGKATGSPRPPAISPGSSTPLTRYAGRRRAAISSRTRAARRGSRASGSTSGTLRRPGDRRAAMAEHSRDEGPNLTPATSRCSPRPAVMTSGEYQPVEPADAHRRLQSAGRHGRPDDRQDAHGRLPSGGRGRHVHDHGQQRRSRARRAGSSSSPTLCRPDCRRRPRTAATSTAGRFRSRPDGDRHPIDALRRKREYPDSTVTVGVAANVPASVTNAATVAGGGDVSTANNSASDPTTIGPASG